MIVDPVNSDFENSRIVAILREVAFGGGERTVDPNSPLGRGGLGLDSLALVEFLTAFENEFDVDLPDEFWVKRETISLRRMHDLIEKDKVEVDSSVASSEILSELSTETETKPALLFRALRAIGASIFNKEFFHIYCLDLSQAKLPQIPLPQNLSFRVAEPSDRSAFESYWPEKEREYKSRRFTERMEKRTTCYLAWLADELASVAWVAVETEYEPHLRLTMRLTEKACYGFDLSERIGFEGRGIGLALLVECLRLMKENGFVYQYNIVHETNEKMIRVLTGMLGFQKVGSISHRKTFGVQSVNWELNGLSSKKREILL